MSIGFLDDLLQGVPSGPYNIALAGSALDNSAGSSASSTSASFTTQNVGDTVYVFSQTYVSSGGAQAITSITHPNIGSWTRAAPTNSPPYVGVQSANGWEIWYGIVTAVGSGTLKVSTSSANYVGFMAIEFSKSGGSWGLDAAFSSATYGANTGTSGVNMPTGTPTGLKELYFGGCGCTGLSSGSTSGYSYVIGSSNMALIYNTNCAESAQTPSINSNLADFESLAIIVKAT